MMYPQAISHGNVLTFTPPGFKQTLNVKFPDCRLAVCEKCKKNYKTRDMCRVRNSHTDEPWTTAFICITLDDTCTDADGKYIDKPLTVRMVQWQPFCVKTPFDKKTPVCSACKKTNRTKSFCRERHKHRQLPWCTVYVLLSALETTDPSTVVAAPSKLLSGNGQPENGNQAAEGQDVKTGEKEGATPAGEPDSAKETPVIDAAAEIASGGATEEESTKGKKRKADGGDSDEGDDINDIADSRTFLAKVSCHGKSVHWLELAEFDANDANAVHGLVTPDAHMQATPGAAGQSMNPPQQQYYAQAVGYAAQQHQHALKSHQQYFFEMQQRQQQQYAAHSAWQAQYNQQPGMQAPGQPHQPVAGAPAPVQPTSGASTQPAQAPVTAGEAAAQQQKQGQSSTGPQPLVMPQQPTQPPAGQEQTAGAAAAAATAAQQQQADPQWQAQMMYHQHLYQQQQMQHPQAQGNPQPGQPQIAPPQQQPQYASMPAPGSSQAPHTMAAVPPGGKMGVPAPVDGMNGNGDENDAKRTRYV